MRTSIGRYATYGVTIRGPIIRVMLFMATRVRLGGLGLTGIA